jgi:hypothetical protein
MKRYYPVFAAVFAVFVLCSCAGTQKKPADTQYWNFYKLERFVPEHFISDNSVERYDAIKKFDSMLPEDRQKVLTYMAYTLGDEDDPMIRAKTFEMLGNLKPGGYIAAPLIEAAKDKGTGFAFRETDAFIRSLNPADFELKPLAGLLSDKDPRVRLSAAKAIGLMGKKGESAMPEIFAAMRLSDDAAHYAEFYDAASMINNEIAVTQVIMDLKNSEEPVRRAALEKLFGLYSYLAKKSEMRTRMFSAFIRMLYSNDETMVKSTQEMLASLNDTGATAALKSYLKMGRTVLISAFNWSGKKMQEIFDRQEQDLQDEVTVYYKLIGRADALKDAAGK